MHLHPNISFKFGKGGKKVESEFLLELEPKISSQTTK
jgi:hypothetical protein